MEVLPPSRGNGANQKSRAFHTNECPSATRGSGRPDGPPPVLFTRIRGSVSNISAVRARRDHVGPPVVRWTGKAIIPGISCTFQPDFQTRLRGQRGEFQFLNVERERTPRLRAKNGLDIGVHFPSPQSLWNRLAKNQTLGASHRIHRYHQSNDLAQRRIGCLHQPFINCQQPLRPRDALKPVILIDFKRLRWCARRDSNTRPSGS